MRRPSPIRLTLVPAVLALLAPGAAAAHARVVRTVPGGGAVLAVAPAAVRVVFDDDVRVEHGARAVRNGGGSVLAGPARLHGPRTVVVPLRRHLPRGDYTVLWRVRSDDGHPLAGVVAFAVGKGRAPPLPSLSASAGPGAAEIVSRWLFLAGVLCAAGTALLALLIDAPARRSVVTVAFVLAFLGASALAAEGAETRFGRITTVAAVVAAVGAAAAATSSVLPRLVPLVRVCALALLPLPTLSGHALDPGRPRLEVAVDLAHVAAAAIWIGGLVTLVDALRSRGRDGGALARRFSSVAVAAVAVLAGTGVVRALAELRAVDQLWTTAYGSMLLVKTALLAALAAAGWLNRYRLVPKVRSAPRPLRRTATAELVLLAALVVVVAFLTDLRPGRDSQTAAAAPAAAEVTGPPVLPALDAVVRAREIDTRVLAVAAVRRAKGIDVQATVVGPDASGLDGLRLRVGSPGTFRRTISCGPGCYSVTVPRRKSLTLVVRGVGAPQRFAFGKFPPPKGARLLGRVTRAFRARRSVEYSEQLASSPTNKLFTSYVLQRPDRLHFHVRNGHEAIIIGIRRWDRDPGRPWVQSPQTLLQQPTPAWRTVLTNAFVSATTRKTIELGFIDRTSSAFPAWFDIVVDRKTLLPRTLRMTAASHFMHHTYTRYDRAPTIRPPRTG